MIKINDRSTNKIRKDTSANSRKRKDIDSEELFKEMFLWLNSFWRTNKSSGVNMKNYWKKYENNHEDVETKQINFNKDS